MRLSAALPLVLGLALLWPTAKACADAGAPARLGPGEREQQLHQLSDQLNAPDPYKRIATLEAVLTGSDAIEKESALQIALASDDASMRHYAAAALLSGTKIINLQVEASPEAKALFDNAARDNGRSLGLHRTTSVFLQQDGGVVPFTVTGYDPATGVIATRCDPGARETDGQFSGSTLQLQGSCQGRPCSATLMQGASGSFKGTLACSGMPDALLASFSLR